jgi:hypothetical protein
MQHMSGLIGGTKQGRMRAVVEKHHGHAGPLTRSPGEWALPRGTSGTPRAALALLWCSPHHPSGAHPSHERRPQLSGPPFHAHATYHVRLAEQGGEKSAAQITAWEDTWPWGDGVSAGVARGSHRRAKNGCRLAASLPGIPWYA